MSERDYPATGERDDERQPRQEDLASEPPAPAVTDAWNEVGEQLHDLGKSLADVLRAVWRDEENRRRAQQMKEGLEAMARELGAAIKESATRDEARQVKDAGGDTARAIKEAGARTWQEAVPRMRQALRRADEGLQRVLQRGDSATDDGATEGGGDEPAREGSPAGGEAGPTSGT